MGSWVTYGLGSENRDLPGFIVFVSGGRCPGRQERMGQRIPALGLSGRSVPHGRRPRALPLRSRGHGPRRLRRTSLDALKDLNSLNADELNQPETATRIAQYELAFRMQIVGARDDGYLA